MTRLMRAKLAAGCAVALITGCRHVPQPGTSAETARSVSWRSSEGFQQTRWGMTVEEVSSIVGSGELEGDLLSVNAKVGGLPSALEYRFLHERLVGVGIHPDASATEAFFRFRNGLVLKFGDPLEESNRDSAAANQRLVAGLSRAGSTATGGGKGPGYDRLDAEAARARAEPWWGWATWVSPETEVRLVATEEKGATLIFRCRALWPDVEAAMKQQF